MRLEGTRFGSMDVDDGRVITFPSGLIGFLNAKSFVLLERGEGSMIAWLQSIDTPALAFPVVPGEMFGADYPTPSARDLARENRLPDADLSVFVIVAAKPGGAGLSANLLAPLIIDVESRCGVQVVLDPNRYAVSTAIQHSVSPSSKTL
jgi:flagellar assembly factor FliW